VGFDFPVIAAQLGIVLDKEYHNLDLCPEMLETRTLYGGLKKVEQKLGLRRQFRTGKAPGPLKRSALM